MKDKIQIATNKIDTIFGISSGIHVSKLVKNNARIAFGDIKSGKIYSSRESRDNLSNVIQDIMKGSLIGIVYLLPGTLIPMTVLRNVLNRSKSDRIKKILYLSVQK